MSEADRQRWNARYADQGGADRPAAPMPAQVLSQGARWLPRGESSAFSAPSARSLRENEGEPLVDAAVPPGDVTGAQTGQPGMTADPGLASGRKVPRALDLACGQAGNGQWLAEHGFQVSAWDISDAVISQVRQRVSSQAVQAEVRDVIADPPLPDSFDVIVVVRFLERALCPAIARALKPGGVLFYQTFTHGLSNPDYCLRANELLSLFDSLRILEYHEPAPDEEGRAEARLIARRD